MEQPNMEQCRYMYQVAKNPISYSGSIFNYNLKNYDGAMFLESGWKVPYGHFPNRSWSFRWNLRPATLDTRKNRNESIYNPKDPKLKI